MKQLFKLSAVFLLIAVFAFIPPKHNPVGHWSISYSNGSKSYIDFYTEGTFRKREKNFRDSKN